MKDSQCSLVDELVDASLTAEVRSILWSRVLLDALLEQEQTRRRRGQHLVDEWVVLRPAGSRKPAA